MSALRRRPARVVPAVVVSVVVLAAAGAVLWAAVARLSEGSWWPGLEEGTRTAGGLAWSAPVAVTAAGIVALAGLVLILCAVLPGGFNGARLRTPQPDDDVVRGRLEAIVTTGGLATLASSAASRVDGVSGVSSSATARTVLVALTTPLRETGPLVEEARSAIERRMEECGVRPAPRIRVRARTKEMS